MKYLGLFEDFDLRYFLLLLPFVAIIVTGKVVMKRIKNDLK